MIANLYEKICQGDDVRTSLINMRQELKQPEGLLTLQSLTKGDYQVFCTLLQDQDPKVRKNAALILGETGKNEMVPVLMQAFEKEETLFIRSDYLNALTKLDYEPYLDQLVARYKQLGQKMNEQENQKHNHQEMTALQKLIVAKRGIQKHEFTGLIDKKEVILTTPSRLRELTARQLKSYQKVSAGLGIKVITDQIWPLFEIRTFDELLFPISCDQKLPPDPDIIGSKIGHSDLLSFLRQTHQGEDTFTFRIGLHGSQTLEERSRFTRKVAIAIEAATNGNLQNSTSGYEIEIRLYQLKTGEYYPCLKLYTIQDPRFRYRKEIVATSIKPVTAARIMELAEPYLSEGAQILDPFCGTGTMLVERALKLPVTNAYGVDTFGEAIAGARENTRRMFPHFHFIQRDFFDFTHDYLFDEVITNMPVRGKMGKEELDRLYTRFFDSVSSFLKPDGIIILYSGETGFVHKQLRLHAQYELLEEHLMNQKLDTNLYLLKVKG